MRGTLDQYHGYIAGAIIITLGIIVIFFPMLLVALTSALFILVGAATISIFHNLRRVHKLANSTEDWEYFNPFHKEKRQRVFIYRRM